LPRALAFAAVCCGNLAAFTLVFAFVPDLVWFLPLLLLLLLPLLPAVCSAAVARVVWQWMHLAARDFPLLKILLPSLSHDATTICLRANRQANGGVWAGLQAAAVTDVPAVAEPGQGGE